MTTSRQRCRVSFFRKRSYSTFVVVAKMHIAHCTSSLARLDRKHLNQYPEHYQLKSYCKYKSDKVWKFQMVTPEYDEGYIRKKEA